VRRATRLPLAVKLSPYFSSLTNMAGQLVEAGADGLVLFNRFYQPDLGHRGHGGAAGAGAEHLGRAAPALRWIAILFGRVGTSLAATTGVHTGLDAAKVLLAGADVAMMTSALLRNGSDHVRTVERELREVMASTTTTRWPGCGAA
jgi:dihydroorotate dehydrogenase (fumarate)